MDIIPDNSGKFLVGYTAADDYTLTLVQRTILEGSATPGTVVDKDITYSTASSSVTWSVSDHVATTSPDNPNVVFSSLTPDICQISSTGVVTPGDANRTNGFPLTCTVRATGKTGSRDVSSIVISEGPGLLYTGVNSVASGSLRKYLIDQQLAAISGVSPGSQSQRANATASDVGSGNAGPVNADCFIRAQGKAGFDAMPQEALDEILAGGTNPAQWRAWISPHHFLTWRGHDSASGATWRSLDGEHVVEYSAIAWGGGTSARLCKILPANFKDYLPDASRFLIYFDFAPEINMWVRAYHTYLSGDKRWVMPIRAASYFGMPPPEVYGGGDPRDAFIRAKRIMTGYDVMIANGGDSGSPLFIGLKGTLVPMGHIMSRGNVPWTGIAGREAEINAAMAELSASGLYTVQTVDLGPSGMNFPSYA